MRGLMRAEEEEAAARRDTSGGAPPLHDDDDDDDDTPLDDMTPLDGSVSHPHDHGDESSAASSAAARVCPASPDTWTTTSEVRRDGSCVA